MGHGIRGLTVCKICNGVGTYENDEITIINDEYYYKIPNGTSYVYETIPKEFKPYFDRLQQENKQLKEKYEKLQEAFKKAITTEHHKIHALLDIIDETKTAVDYMIGNVDISEIHGTKLKQILDKVGETDE